MSDISSIESDRLSWFRTRHTFLHYAEIRTPEDFVACSRWAREREIPVYILGKGSNTLFKRRKISTLVLLNKLPATMNELEEGRLEVSSSLPVMKILKYCEQRQLDSCYFLASVPATVGGALAMNAGEGSGRTFYDFVESVTILEDGKVRTLRNSEIERSHRTTPFTGVQDRFILSAQLSFQGRVLSESEIRKRVMWSQAHQDPTLPNCGSIFKHCHRPLFRYLRWIPPYGISIPGFRAQWSRKVSNWIVNKNSSSWAIVALIRFAQLVHRVLGKKAETEVVIVD